MYSIILYLLIELRFLTLSRPIEYADVSRVYPQWNGCILYLYYFFLPVFLPWEQDVSSRPLISYKARDKWARNSFFLQPNNGSSIHAPASCLNRSRLFSLDFKTIFSIYHIGRMANEKGGKQFLRKSLGRYSF